MIGAFAGSGQLPFALLLVLMVVGILLSNDDDLPGPRRSFARAASDLRFSG